jgi:hypothetical protein
MQDLVQIKHEWTPVTDASFDWLIDHSDTIVQIENGKESKGKRNFVISLMLNRSHYYQRKDEFGQKL